jgi:hypothetical protein
MNKPDPRCVDQLSVDPLNMIFPWLSESIFVDAVISSVIWVRAEQSSQDRSSENKFRNRTLFPDLIPAGVIGKNHLAHESNAWAIATLASFPENEPILFLHDPPGSLDKVVSLSKSDHCLSER